MDKQTAKLIARIAENLPVLPPEVMQDWIEHPKNLQNVLAQLVSPPTLKNRSRDTTHLRYLESITLAPTAGLTVLAEASDLFTGHLDSDFKSLGTDKPGEDTTETILDIYEIAKDGHHRTFFGSLGQDVRPLTMTQGQIKEFACSYRDSFIQYGYVTMSLFEVEGELFVAHINLRGGKLGVDVYRFSEDGIWRTNNRFQLVVPQQSV